MTTSIEIKKSKRVFNINDFEDLCKRAREAGALGVETIRIHVEKGDRPFDSDNTTISVEIITERSASRVDPY